MVNDRQKKLLSFIQNSPMSGEAIASRLGISRVAVWKTIQSLKTQGFAVSVTPEGYVCADEYYDFEHIHGYQIRYFYETSSTMDELCDLTDTRPLLVIAEKQSQGRGQKDRIWLSDKGGLYCTVTVTRKFPAALVYRAVFAMKLAVCMALEDENIRAKVKWPNDVLVDDRKIAGVIANYRVLSGMIQNFSIGCGINLNNGLLPEGALSIQKLTGKKTDRTAFLQRLLSYWEKLFTEIYDDTIDGLWLRYSSTIGRKIRVVQEGAFIEGIAISLEPGGGLTVKDVSNVYTALYGDCIHC